MIQFLFFYIASSLLFAQLPILHYLKNLIKYSNFLNQN